MNNSKFKNPVRAVMLLLLLASTAYGQSRITGTIANPMIGGMYYISLGYNLF